MQLFLLIILVSFSNVQCHSNEHHGHSHGEHDHGGHGHSHGSGGHAHSHGGHAHSHGEHSHSHSEHDSSNSHAKMYSREMNVPKKHILSDEWIVPKQDWNEIWTYAISSTMLISAAPFFILFLIPLESNSVKYEPLLKILLSFASGGLLGDAFLHLIPHALMEVEKTTGGHGHGHSHGAGEEHAPHDISVGMSVLVGIMTFLLIEKLVRHVKGGGHSHDHGSRGAVEPNAEEDENDKKPPSKKAKQNDGSITENPGNPPEYKVSGYLNLVADFAHNFTDGLAIAASYTAGKHVGMVTTFTILFHEVPHEIGDFAILVQSGMPKRRAISMQLITAIGALAGTVIGLAAQGAGESASVWILPFTAGGFIYIATVSVIPELLVESNLWQSFKELLAMSVGVGMMVVIAAYE